MLRDPNFNRRTQRCILRRFEVAPVSAQRRPILRLDDVRARSDMWPLHAIALPLAVTLHAYDVISLQQWQRLRVTIEVVLLFLLTFAELVTKRYDCSCQLFGGYWQFLQRVSIACYAERCTVYSKSVHPSVRLSHVTRWHRAKTTQVTIMWSSLKDSLITLVS